MKTILIVDDNDEIRANVAEVLILSKYNVITACNGKEGLEAVRNRIPDLIISDIIMPLVDGLGMLHILRRDPNTDAIPFIFLTSKAGRNDFRNAMETGADDFISKPFSNDELLKAIDNRFKSQEAVSRKRAISIIMGGEDGDIKESLESLFVNSSTRTYMNRDVIYKEGATARSLYFIVKGKSRSYKTNEIGKSLSIDLYTTGDFLGINALLQGGAYKENAEVIEDNTVIAMVPRSSFDDLIYRNPAIAQRLVKIMAKDISVKNKHMLDIAYNSLRQNVANTLVGLENKYHTNKNEPYSIDLSRDILASMAGSSVEAYVRMLGEFKTEKLVSIGVDKKIEIINFNKLEKIASLHNIT